MYKVSTVVVGDIGTNCYIVASEENTAAIIDPGAQADKIIKHLENKELTPKYILLTHGHHDHIGAVKELKAKYPELQVGVSKEDAIMVSDPELNYSKYRANAADKFKDLKEDFTIAEGDTIEFDGLSFDVYACPGHTMGGLCYVIGEDMFTGDSLFAGDIGRTDLFGGHYETLINSVKRIMLIPGEYNVHPGHGPSSTMARERKHNNYVRV